MAWLGTRWGISTLHPPEMGRAEAHQSQSPRAAELLPRSHTLPIALPVWLQPCSDSECSHSITAERGCQCLPAAWAKPSSSPRSSHQSLPLLQGPAQAGWAPLQAVEQGRSSPREHLTKMLETGAELPLVCQDFPESQLSPGPAFQQLGLLSN